MDIRWIKARKGFLLFSLLRISVMFLGLISNIFIVRKLSIADFGTYSVALMLIGLFTTLGFSWSSSSILYFGSREKAKFGNLNKTFWARNIILFSSLIIMTIMFVLFHKQINAYIGLDVSLLMLLWLFVSVAEDYLNQYFLAVKRQLLSSVLSFTAKVIFIILILLIDFDVRTLLILNIISHATVIFYILGINKKDIGSFEFDKSWFKEVLNFSLWQLFGFSGLYLINFGDTAVIKHFMTTEDVGIYNAAYKLFMAVAGFSFVISSYYASNVTTHFANNNYKKIGTFFYKDRLYIVALSTMAHVLVMLFAEPIIVTLYGEKYTEAVSIFNILMIGSIMRYLTVFYMLYYNTNGKHRLQQIINIFGAFLNLGLDIIFIQYFGLVGPAIATTISILFTLLFSVYYCEKRIRFASKEEGSHE